VRGPDVRRLGLRLPPARMPLLRRGRPLKRWRYVAVYRPDLMLCVGDARVAGIPQRWFALALPDGTLVERDSGVDLATPGRARVEASGVSVDLAFEESDGMEIVSPSGRSWAWTRKQALLQVRGTVRALGRTWSLDGPDGFVDDSAGYHERHTTWRWSAGVGRAAGGAPVAWNLVAGVHDGSPSERTVWVDGEPREVGPVEFAEDLSGVGGLRFTPWSAREDHTRRLFFASDYLQPFGTFEGELPGGVRLEAGYGVMEWHDVRW
jgi:hypothetical protein